MSETESVKVVRDTGYKERWGLAQFLYRQDGKKLTLKGKCLLSAVATLFVFSSIFVLIRGPTQMEMRSPIIFNGAVSQVSTIEVPRAADRSEIERRRRGIPTLTVIRHYGGLQLVNRPRLGQIPPGLLVKAKLLTGASNGLVKATLIEPLSINGESIAETGSMLIGNGSSTEERLNVEFSKLVFRDGTHQSIKAQACDVEDQTIGLKGSKVGKYTSLLAAGVGLNFAGGLAEGLQENEVQNGVTTKKTDIKNAALNGAGKASIEQSKEIIEKWKQQKTVIEVKQGTEICVIFDGD
jgi:hypothetical protein